VLKRFGGAQFSAFKTALADLTIDKLAPIRGEMRRLADDPTHTDKVLAEGAAKARAIARPNMDVVKDILGLLR
jgi:tryptophanyl-tRNA synthetase